MPRTQGCKSAAARPVCALFPRCVRARELPGNHPSEKGLHTVARRVRTSVSLVTRTLEIPGASEDLVLLLGPERVRNPGRMPLFRVDSSGWFCTSRSPGLVVFLPHRLSLTNFTTWHFFPETWLCASLIFGRGDGGGGATASCRNEALGGQCSPQGSLLWPLALPPAMGAQQPPAPALP